MNIIIVRNARSLPRRLDFSGRKGHLKAGALLAVAACALMALGAGVSSGIAAWRASGSDELSDLRGMLDRQRADLASISADSRRNLDALAAQVGRLQAQATRLNALGERLAEVGKLDGTEFDFGSEPAVGGPETESGLKPPAPLQASLDQLSAQFSRQEAQLELLETMLRDRKIDSALLPTGMPVAAGYIASGFGARTDPLDGHAGMHYGIDIDAPHGTDIAAVADGVVTWSGERSGYGNVVEIDHGNGYMTRYAHNSANVAEVGQRVRSGDVVAKLGSTGRSTGPHCHFEVWRDGRAVDPMSYVKSKRG